MGKEIFLSDIAPQPNPATKLLMPSRDPSPRAPAPVEEDAVDVAASGRLPPRHQQVWTEPSRAPSRCSLQTVRRHPRRIRYPQAHLLRLGPKWRNRKPRMRRPGKHGPAKDKDGDAGVALADADNPTDLRQAQRPKYLGARRRPGQGLRGLNGSRRSPPVSIVNSTRKTW